MAKKYNNKIDVIIPAYNVPDNILFRCLASIACQDIADYLPDNCKAMTSKLSEVTEPASLIKVLMKHARIQVEQAVKDHEHQPRQKSLDAILS